MPSGGGGNSANPSVANVLRVLDFELFGKLRHTERQRKYPVTNTKELSCNNANYVAMNKKLDCFGSVEPYNDVTSCPPLAGGGFAYGRSKTSTDVALNSLAPCGRGQGEGSMCTVEEQYTQNDKPFLEKNFSHFTEPSRGMSEAKVEQTSTETLSFRCVCERCRLMRGEVHKSRRKAAFTLAEVLITLGIIGVVAAITMPVLLSNVQDRVKEKRVENIKQKLSKVTDKMAVQSGLTGYGDTMAFVQEMSKHMKLAKVCDNSHLSDCWPTQEVILDDEGKTWEISKTKNAKTLKILKDDRANWSDTVGIVTADGTPMILSYKKTCDFDVDKEGLIFNKDSAMSNSMKCLSGVFDWNGGKKPNKLAKLKGDSKGDVLIFGSAGGLGTECAFEINGTCFTAPFTPTPLTKAECEEEVKKGTLGIKACYYDTDYWAGAVTECGGVGNMPTMAQLGQLATELYGRTVGAKQDIYSGLTLDTSKASSMGFTGSPFYVWSGEEYTSKLAYTRNFYSSHTYCYDRTRGSSKAQAVCLGD